MTSYPHPGVYREDVEVVPTVPVEPGVPAFLGDAAGGPVDAPQGLLAAEQLAETFGPPAGGGYLSAAVHGFFANGGRRCYAVRLKPEPTPPRTALRDGLAALAAASDLDLVCVPDLMRQGPADVAELQQEVLAHCDAAGDRFAILDALPLGTGADLTAVEVQRAALAGTNGALYGPWVRPRGGAGFVPPSGHVAGLVSRTDRRDGVHKAPANEELDDLVDLDDELTPGDRQRLVDAGVNLVRAFPGRGFRVWGARTLSPDPAWRYVNVRRLVLQIGREVGHRLAGVAFEPHDQPLWTRIHREIEGYLSELFAAGALHGATAGEAFYVKCDGETNPPEVRDAGQVVTEIGLAPASPGELVVVRIVQNAGGLRLEAPAS